MKKLLALLMALAMLFTFAACGNSGSKDDDDKDEKVEKDKDEDEEETKDEDKDDEENDKDAGKDDDKDNDKENDKDTGKEDDKDTGKEDEGKDNGKKEESSDAYTKCVPVLVDILNGDFSQLESLAPKAYWDYAKEEFESYELDFDMDTLISFNEEEYESELEYMEEYFGSDPTYKLSVEGSEKMSQDDLDTIAAYLSDEGVDVDIKAGYAVTMKMELSGSDDSEEDTIDMYVIQIGSGWYPIYGEVDGENTYVDFVANDYVSDYVWQNAEMEDTEEEYYY